MQIDAIPGEAPAVGGRRRPAVAASVMLAALLSWIGNARAIEWPQQIAADEGTIVVYQPQPDKLDGNLLSGRAAMSLELQGREPVFGAFWFDAKVDTGVGGGAAVIRDVTVTKVRWPESKDAGEQRFTAIVEGAVPEHGFEISMESLSASLKTADIERESLENLNNDPPRILFREELAVLLLYDGEPRFSPVEGSDYERALNTPFVVVRTAGGDDLYLSSGTFWYQARDPMGPWTPTDSPPQDLVAMLPDPESDDQPPPDSPPAIVAATEPTELIVTQGAPDWQSLPGGELLYVENTESPWLRELATGNMYVLLSGRWYRSESKDGPWTFVRADELPPSFSEIPPDSAIGGLRTSVAGTEEAEDAMLDAQIPQTAAIDRDEATLEVEYDGEPKFERISDTAVSYAVNTGAQVLEIDDRYYVVDGGVWFTSPSPTGPWVVADSVPEEEIQEIPPESPVYNTTYVHIYDSTPEVVYVGYTPGYLWSFPYYGVPVYGTGWYYPPYWGSAYYPRPPTWGFHVGYNPWTGWNFGVSWSNGFFSFGMSWSGGWDGAYRPWGCCGGWYGGGYRGPVVINTGNINIGNNINVGNRRTVRNRIDRSTNIDFDRSRTNVYNRPQNRTRNTDRATARPNLKRARPLPNRENDVFADRDGNVARRAAGDWQTRQDGGWRSAEQAQDRYAGMSGERAQPSFQSGNFDRAGLERAYAARQHGIHRTRSRPGGMYRRR